MRKVGNLIISLDFELIWGVHDCETVDSFRDRVRGTREAIPRLLELFQKYDIHATWATVGLLFSKNKQELFEAEPQIKPNYKNEKLSVYNYFDTLGESEDEDPLHYASSLIDLIKNTNGQEIGCHTFSHYYCSAEGQTKESFSLDLQSSKKIALKKGLELKSLVLPRNQFTKESVEVAIDNGFVAVRGNPERSAYNSNKKLAKALRLIDSYLNIYDKCYDKKDLLCGDCVNVRASSFFRQYNTKLKFLEPLKISCIKRQMKKAAKQGKVFHLWWHPHNIGKNTDKNLSQLEKLFQYYKLLEEKYSFKSQSMYEFAEEVLSENSFNVR